MARKASNEGGTLITSAAENPHQNAVPVRNRRTIAKQKNMRMMSNRERLHFTPSSTAPLVLALRQMEVSSVVFSQPVRRMTSFISSGVRRISPSISRTLIKMFLVIKVGEKITESRLPLVKLLVVQPLLC